MVKFAARFIGAKNEPDVVKLHGARADILPDAVTIAAARNRNSLLPFGAIGMPGFEGFIERAAIGLGVMNVPEADDGWRTEEIIIAGRITEGDDWEGFYSFP
jgi:hypothetical protein